MLSVRWVSVEVVCDCDKRVCDCDSDAVLFCVAQLVADRTIDSVRARIDFFNRISENVYFFLQLNHILAQRLDHQFHYHLYGLFVVVELMPAHIRECFLNVGAELIYLGFML